MRTRCWSLPLLALAALAGCGRTTPLSPRSQEIDAPDASQDACRLVADPASVDLGEVPLGSSASAWLEVTNTGRVGCEIVIGSRSDPEFSLPSTPTAPFQIQAGETVSVQVRFEATSREPPRRRTGTVVVLDTETHLPLFVPLAATILVGCDLQLTPGSLDFGKVSLNTSASRAVTLVNSGDAPCEVSDLALAPGSDRLFSISDGQPAELSLPPGATGTIGVSFSGADSTEPHERSGTLTFTRSQPSGLPATAPAEVDVPLHAVIDTLCIEGSQWIYTVADDGRFASFDPLHARFTDLGQLSCPDFSTPFSMAVDQSAVAWVEYSDGALYRVDARTVSCSPTSFTGNPDLTNFGMGFVFDPEARQDTLYVAGGWGYGAIPSTLGVISFPSLSLSPVASIGFGAPELTGTGDGQLWGFAPSFNSASGVTTLGRIDPQTGELLAQFTFPELSNSASSYALAFWGGSFWLFLGPSIYEVKRSTGELSVAATDTGRNIVGVGVSSCAPIR